MYDGVRIDGDNLADEDFQAVPILGIQTPKISTPPREQTISSLCNKNTLASMNLGKQDMGKGQWTHRSET